MTKTVLPIIVLKNIVLFPNSEIRVEVENAKDKETISLAESYYNKNILIVHQKDVLETNLDIAGLTKTGIIGNIAMKIELPNNKTRIIIRGINRVNISEISKEEDELLLATIKQIELEEFDEIEEVAYCRSLIKQFEYYVDNNPTMSNSILSQITNLQDLNKLTDIICLAFPSTYDRKLEYIEEINPTIRTTMLLEDMNQELKILSLEKKIDEKISQNLDKAQKDYILQEKLKAIKEELGVTFDKEDECLEIKEKIDTNLYPKNVKEKLKKELNRYETAPITSPEIGIIRNYIDWLLNLPWSYETKDNIDLNKAKSILDKSHFGLEDVKDRIIEYLALEQFSKNRVSPIICLVGPPGVGKTSFAKSIAKAMHRKYVKISVGGVNDEAEIVGHRRTYIGSSPGRIITGLKKAKSKNPVFVIDEIDKLCKDIKGDPASCLLEVLDKEQNYAFYDHYIEEPFDLSKVMFICTANYEENIPLELLDRLEIIYMNSYTEYEKLEIVKHYLIPKKTKLYGFNNNKINFTDQAILKIIRNYTKEAGIRELERIIDKIFRKIIKEIVINKKNTNYMITEKELFKYLKKEIYLYNDSYYKSRIGIVNGMSYSYLGGDILPIEVNYFKGNGNITVTGSLGEIFIESIKISLDYIKSYAKKLGIDYNLLQQNDIHIHVPEGATKKEGPSAGIAITTALISAFKHKEILDSISMTGEITIRGNILPIGGLKEKIIGAKRANIRKIIIPKKNERDLQEIDQKIKEGIEFILVNNYEEVVDKLKL